MMRSKFPRWTFSQPATLELTHNWGTESEEGLPYHRFRSFLHSTAHVNDCSVATVIPEGLATLGLLCQMLMKLVPGAKNQIILADMEFGRFEKEGVDFVKKPNDGKMKGLAFIKVVG